MHAWLCTNPTGVEALAWTELPDPAPKAGEVLVEIRAASLNFPDLLMVQNKYQIKPPPAFRARLGVRGRRAGRGRRRQPSAGGSKRGLSQRHGWFRHAHHRPGRTLYTPAGRLWPCGCGGIHHDLCNLLPRPAGPGPAPGRRNRAGAGRGWRRGHRRDSDRQGQGSARDRRRLHGRKMRRMPEAGRRCRDQLQRGGPARRRQVTDRWAGTGRHLRPGGRRTGRARISLHRLARPLSGGRLRIGPHPFVAVESATAQGCKFL